MNFPTFAKPGQMWATRGRRRSWELPHISSLRSQMWATRARLKAQGSSRVYLSGYSRGDMVYGSASDAMSDMPLPPPAAGPTLDASTPISIERIMLATDFDPVSEAALHYSLSIARGYG